MLILTKQMKKDLKRLREQDLVVCDYCGSEEVTEKIWVDVNHYVMINGESYFQYSSEGYDEYRCRKCMNDTVPISITEYKGDEDAKQKS